MKSRLLYLINCFSGSMQRYLSDTSTLYVHCAVHKLVLVLSLNDTVKCVTINVMSHLSFQCVTIKISNLQRYFYCSKTAVEYRFMTILVRFAFAAFCWGTRETRKHTY